MQKVTTASVPEKDRLHTHKAAAAWGTSLRLWFTCQVEQQTVILFVPTPVCQFII
jgi:hypothetical protein